MTPEHVDISEDEILRLSPEAFKQLLLDHTTGKNIFWATDNYADRGEGYRYSDPIKIENITGEENNRVIVPRSCKPRERQQQRSREMAEVFTPSWICNKQNNLIDEAWFGRRDVFNSELDTPAGGHNWQPTVGPVTFPAGKTWQDYVAEVRMEITCGEAPYLVSRYDTVTGLPLDLNRRIGLLDRKLRVVGENTTTSGEWLAAARAALRSIYAFEWQGDNLLLARENILYTVRDFYREKFGKELPNASLPGLAYIISWNIWQMDGLKGVIPDSCDKKEAETNLFGEPITCEKCLGCRTGHIRAHNGTYAKIVEWPRQFNTSNVAHKAPIRFIDLIK